MTRFRVTEVLKVEGLVPEDMTIATLEGTFIHDDGVTPPCKCVLEIFITDHDLHIITRDLIQIRIKQIKEAKPERMCDLPVGAFNYESLKPAPQDYWHTIKDLNEEGRFMLKEFADRVCQKLGVNIEDALGHLPLVCDRCGKVNPWDTTQCSVCEYEQFHELTMPRRVGCNCVIPRYHETYCSICGEKGQELPAETCGHQPGCIYDDFECFRPTATEMYCSVCGHCMHEDPKLEFCEHKEEMRFMTPARWFMTEKLLSNIDINDPITDKVVPGSAVDTYWKTVTGPGEYLKHVNKPIGPLQDIPGIGQITPVYTGPVDPRKYAAGVSSKEDSDETGQ